MHSPHHVGACLCNGAAGCMPSTSLEAHSLSACVRACCLSCCPCATERYQEFVPDEYGRYCAEMSRSGNWGDHVTLQVIWGVGQLVAGFNCGCAHLPLWGRHLNGSQWALFDPQLSFSVPRLVCLLPQAAADFFGLKISLVTSFRDSCFMEIEPQQACSPRVLWLSFWAEVGRAAGLRCACGTHTGHAGTGMGRGEPACAVQPPCSLPLALPVQCHYNSLYPKDEPPPVLPSQKLFGSRRLYNMLFTIPSPMRY